MCKADNWWSGRVANERSWNVKDHSVLQHCNHTTTDNKESADFCQFVYGVGARCKVHVTKIMLKTERFQIFVLRWSNLPLFECNPGGLQVTKIFKKHALQSNKYGICCLTKAW